MFSQAIVSLLAGIAQTLIDLQERLDRDIKGLGLEPEEGLRKAADGILRQISTMSEKFTICVIGEFKVGKSTLINGLLALLGDAALASAESLDTACSVMIRMRQENQPEATLIFKGGSGLARRDASWSEAKRYTSQVHRNADPRIDREAQSLVRVDYFVSSSILENSNLNDLPGTGSVYWTHTSVAEENIRVADAILWLMFQQEPTHDGTRFLDMVARQDQRVIPVINVRQEAGELPDLDIAEEIAGTVRRAYRQHFETGIVQPLFYSARTVELERGKPEPDPAVLEQAGYFAIVEQLFGADATNRRSQAKSARVYGASREFLRDSVQIIRRQLVRIAEVGEKTKESGEGIGKRLDELDDIHEQVNFELRQLAEAYAASTCQVIREICGRFIDENLSMANIDALKIALTKPTDELTEHFARTFQEKYLKDDPRLLACERRYAENARQLLRSSWRSQKDSWNGKTQAPRMPSRTFSLAEGDDMENAMLVGLGKLGGMAALAGLVAVALPWIVLAIPFANHLARNPMAKMREDAKVRAGWEIHSWRVNLEDTFASSWSEESRRIQSEIEEKLHGSHGATNARMNVLDNLETLAKDVAASIETVIEKVHMEQTGRSTGA